MRSIAILESEINNQPLDRGRDRYSCCLLNISAEYFNDDSFVDGILLTKFLFDFFVILSSSCAIHVGLLCPCTPMAGAGRRQYFLVLWGGAVEIQ